MWIELRIKESSSSDFSVRPYDPNDDDVRSILWDVCQAIGQRGEFLVSGFGQDHWPVDVQTDLPVFLEQLPSAIMAVSEGMPTEIEFYEQGIERSITLMLEGGVYVAACKSSMSTCWQTNSISEEVDREELKEMLLAVREVFMRFFADTAPGLVKHPWIQQWLKGTSG
ncbi:hypothetical protein [Cupriavidus malaysiensis]|uniref:hypothetical protein n=1 Tax=Cupriavidus malaysiensis TaxID=367825 RepID=UPI0012FFC9C9|nr:hypothetical protein [Cupriavidus malaysiensis]